MLPDETFIQDLATNKENQLWISLEQISHQVSKTLISSSSKTIGFLRFENDNWTLFPLGEYGLPQVDYPLRQITSDSLGRLWFYDPPHTIFCFDGEKCGAFHSGQKGLPSDMVNINLLSNPFVHDAKGDLWVAMGPTGFYHFDGTNWQKLSKEKHRLTDGWVTKATLDFVGRLWFTIQQSKSTQFVCYDGKQCRVYADVPVGFEEAVIQAFAVDRKGRLFVSWEHMSDGLWVIDPKDNTFQKMTTFNSALPGNEIISVTLDKSGRVWVGAFEGGVTIFQGNQSVYWSAFTPGVIQVPGDDHDPKILLSYDLVANNNGQIWARSYDGKNEGVCTFIEVSARI